VEQSDACEPISEESDPNDGEKYREIVEIEAETVRKKSI
jgi:hypothetical protein